MKTNSKDSGDSKPVSFRLAADVFEILHVKGLAKGLSAHEFACKMIQDGIGLQKIEEIIKSTNKIQQVDITGFSENSAG